MFAFIRRWFSAWRTPITALGQLAPWRYSFDDGSKFAGGYGFTQLLQTDYWTLRQRSAELFETNIYARGIVRRLVTNEINVGLHLEATPEEGILGKPEDSLADWAETVENRFQLWCDRPQLCDQAELLTFGSIQAVARLEALVAGDVLVTMRQDARTGLPRVQLVNGGKVQTPFGMELGNGNTIKHGVELDASGRHVAYWVQQDDRTYKRLPAYGEKSGRRLAWLLYGTDKRLDDVRGKPLLSLVLQALKEIDRYRDAKLRAAVVSGMLALFVKKNEDKPGTMPMMGGAVRRGSQPAESTGTVAGEPRSFRTAEHVPGLVIDELQHGEEPTAFQSSVVTEGFGVFEEAIVQSVAWHFQIPPEILTLSFSSNYSASKAAVNEFEMHLNKVRTEFGHEFNQPIYLEWLLAEVRAMRVIAPGLLEAWRDPAQYDTFAAWISADWAGQIKPSVDAVKEVAGYAAKLEIGAITYDRASRELTGMKFSKNVKKLKREIEQLVEALKPLAELDSLRKAPAQLSNESTPSEDDDKPAAAANYPRRRALALLAGNAP
jgi:lambda family phage portal protein